MSNYHGVDADDYAARRSWAPRGIITASWLVVVVPAYVLVWFCLIVVDFVIHQWPLNPASRESEPPHGGHLHVRTSIVLPNAFLPGSTGPLAPHERPADSFGAHQTNDRAGRTGPLPNDRVPMTVARL
jgi:hypothetical protein